MPENRYRAWDKQRKLYLTPKFNDQLILRPDGSVWWVSNEIEIEDISDRVEIEFFTGLKDKNGKEPREIYEGDAYRGRKSGMVFVVEFEDGEFRLTKNLERSPHRLKHADLHYALFNLDIEYIGDIHTTPELLEAK